MRDLEFRRVGEQRQITTRHKIRGRTELF